MNAIAAILQALKTWPEPPTLEVDGVELLEVAEFHSRLAEIGQVVSELKKIAALDLAAKLDGKAFRYGESIIRPNFRGAPKIKNDDAWWSDVIVGLQASPNPKALLAALYPASSVRLGALPKLAAALSEEAGELRERNIEYQEPTSPLSVMPMSKAPKFLQDMEEGDIR